MFIVFVNVLYLFYCFVVFEKALVLVVFLFWYKLYRSDLFVDFLILIKANKHHTLLVVFYLDYSSNNKLEKSMYLYYIYLNVFMRTVYIYQKKKKELID